MMALRISSITPLSNGWTTMVCASGVVMAAMSFSRCVVP